MSRHNTPPVGLSRLLLLVSWTLSACQGTGAAEVHHLPEAVPKPAAVRANEARTLEGDPAAAAVARSSRYNATTEAHRASTISPSVSGVIEKVHVKEGDRVARGDILVTLDRTSGELRLRQALAGLSMAQAQAKAAETEAKRATQLRADNAIPVAQVDQATAHLDVASAGVAQAQVAVKMARQGLTDSQIRAPYDGVIAGRMASEGEFAASMPPKMLVVLQELTPIDLRITIPAGDARTIQVGSAIKVYFDDRSEPVEGTISRISPALDPQTRSLTAIAELANADGALRPGLFASVEIAKKPAAHADDQGPKTP